MFNSKNPNYYTTFLLYSGYVESQACSPVIVSMSRAHRFAEQQTKEEACLVAFNSMRKVFLDAVKLYHGFDGDKFVPNYCCMSAKDVDKFCPQCGANLKKTFPSEKEEIQEMVWKTMEGLTSSNNDTWSGELWPKTDRAGWVIPGEILPGIISVVYENAEVSIVDPSLLTVQNFELRPLE